MWRTMMQTSVYYTYSCKSAGGAPSRNPSGNVCNAFPVNDLSVDKKIFRLSVKIEVIGLQESE